MKRYTIGLITGALLTASAFMFMGSQKKNLGDITVNSLTVETENKSGSIVIKGDLMSILGQEGTISLGNGLIAVRENKEFYSAVLIGMDDKEGGSITIFDSRTREPVIDLGVTIKRGGAISVNNSKKNEIVFLGGNTNEDGLIILNDRYGETGWAMSGKK